MALSGQAKADYQREYMRRRRAGDSVVRPGKTDEETEALKAEVAALKAKLAAALTLRWGIYDFGGGRYCSSAETLAGAYGVHWTATNKPRGGGENRSRPLGGENRSRPLPEGESFEAKVSPWGKGNRRKKDVALGTFATLDAAQAACQEYEIALRG